MTAVMALCAPLACLLLCAAAQKESATIFACNLKAISTSDRPRYADLVHRLRTAIRSRREIANGYTYKLNSATISLSEAAEWIGMERLCCPFLTLQLSASGKEDDWVLTLTGPKGAKALIEAEFPMR